MEVEFGVPASLSLALQSELNSTGTSGQFAPQAG